MQSIIAASIAVHNLVHIGSKRESVKKSSYSLKPDQIYIHHKLKSHKMPRTRSMGKENPAPNMEDFFAELMTKAK